MRFVEHQTGTYATVDAPDDHRRIELGLEISFRLLSRAASGELAGHVTADGIARRAPLSGGVARTPGGLRYELQFAGEDGRTFSFLGVKQIALGEVTRGLLAMDGELFDDAGHRYATTTTRFSPRADFAELLASLRWR